MRNIEEIFSDRTCYKFLNKPVSKQLLKEIYDTMKLGPTSANCSPLRIIFVESHKEKDKLSKLVMQGNVAKVLSAPVTAIFAYDPEFYNEMPMLHPHDQGQMEGYFRSNQEVALDTAIRNSTLQAAYFMIIARANGLACGPMSGFDPGPINKEFLAGTKYRVNFMCNLGYRDGENTFPKLPRLGFDESCKIV